MKLSNIKYQGLEQIGFYCLVLTVFTLPFFQKAVPITIAAWATISVVTIFINKIKIKLDYTLFAMLTLYLLYAISWFWSADKSAANFDLQQKLSLLVFPVIFSFIRYNRRQIRILFKAFIYGCIIALIYSLSLSIGEFIRTGSIYYLFYERLSYGLHVAYFSMYLDFVLLLLGIDLIEKKFNIFSSKYVSIAIMLFLGVFTFMLSSKAGVIVLITLLYTLLIYNYVRIKNIKLFIFSILLLSGGFYASFQLLNSSTNRFTSMNKDIKHSLSKVHEINDNEQSKTKGSSLGSTGIRINIWEASIPLIKEEPFFGYGAGDVHAALQKAYKSAGFNDALEKRLNAHNQYFETTLAIGLIGLVLFLFFLFGLSYKALKLKNLFIFGFIFIIAFNMLTEAMLERQAGIVFITLFFCLFTSHINMLSETKN